MIFSPTSHFLGFPISSSCLEDIFLQLGKILWKNNEIVEFQNILSLHISIWYFPETFPDTIENSLKNFPEKEISFSLSGCGTFGKPGDPKVYFLTPTPQNTSIEYNSILLDVYPELRNFWENHLSFVPHMTLFRILNREKFLEKRWEVERYLQTELINISKILFSSSLSVFAVDSRVQPELQVLIS